jgi:putative DNA primase/helicase
MAFGPPKPVPLAVNPVKIPLMLRRIPNWVLWKYQLKRQKDGVLKWTKVPFQPSGECASAGDARTWSTFEVVLDAYQRGGFAGIGLVTAGADIPARRRDKLVLIDLDKVRDPLTGVIAPWAAPILEAGIKERAYVELSPSATGFHIIGEGPQGFVGKKANGCELYCSLRFFTITGGLLFNPKQRALGTLDQTIKLVSARLGIPKPMHKEPKLTRGPAVVGVRPYVDSWTDEDILDMVFTKHNGDKLRRVLAGDSSDYGDDASAADMAAATMLGFWFWLDAAAIERVMRASDLSRDKWDTKRGKVTYLRYTIDRALDGKEDYYGRPGRIISNDNNAWVRV